MFAILGIVIQMPQVSNCSTYAKIQIIRTVSPLLSFFFSKIFEHYKIIAFKILNKKQRIISYYKQRMTNEINQHCFGDIISNEYKQKNLRKIQDVMI